MSLSPQGERLFEITARLFQAENEAKAFLRGDTGSAGGHLRVAADGPVLPLPILSRLKAERPQLTFSLSVDNSARVMEQIIDYRADVAITARAPDDPRLYGVKFLSMRLGLCVPVSHPLAARESVFMAELEGLSFVMRERGSRTREIFEKNLADHGISIQRVIEISPARACGRPSPMESDAAWWPIWNSATMRAFPSCRCATPTNSSMNMRSALPKGVICRWCAGS